jgi:DNA-binding HxlR family transcriptional regulator
MTTPAAVSQTNARLEKLGLLQRTVHSTTPPRTSYALAPSGADLQRVLDAIDCWARAHLDSVPPSISAAAHRRLDDRS